MKAGDWVKRTGPANDHIALGTIIRVDNMEGANYFRSGGKLRLTRNYTVIREDGFRVGDKCLTLAGETITIAEIINDGETCIDTLGMYCNTMHLTLVEPAPAHKFKVGDMVLPVEGYMRGNVNKAAKVIEVRECDGYVRIDTGAPWFLNPDALKHVLIGVDHAKPGSDKTVFHTLQNQGRAVREPSLIKTERRVVQGQFGIVTVNAKGNVSLWTQSPKADELREAAHVLNQIAEVLDDVSE